MRLQFGKNGMSFLSLNDKKAKEYCQQVSNTPSQQHIISGIFSPRPQAGAFAPLFQKERSCHRTNAFERNVSKSYFITTARYFSCQNFSGSRMTSLEIESLSVIW